MRIFKSEGMKRSERKENVCRLLSFEVLLQTESPFPRLCVFECLEQRGWCRKRKS